MKWYWIRFFLLILGIAIAFVLANVMAFRVSENSISQRNVIAQRITNEIEEKSYQISTAVIDYDGILKEVFDMKRSEWEALYGKNSCPVDAKIYLMTDNVQFSANETTEKRINTQSGTIVSGIYFNDELTALVEYTFPAVNNRKIIIFMNFFLGLAALVLIINSLWVYKKIVAPFNKLSDYPERLSKGALTEKLPEKKDKYFGRYIWGMNMLSDKLHNDRKKMEKLSVEHQKFITTMVHGIKTPAASIKLLAEAIATGLYDPEGKVNEKDAELAEKIKKNADDIEKLVADALSEENTVIFDYDYVENTFYRNDIKKFVFEEYNNRFIIKKIPFTVEAEGNPLIKSDFDGICRILRQLLDNAIKYGDGTGVTLKMEKREEGDFFTVENNGTPLPDSEVSFVFNSMWRGSNSKDVAGNGIGLYESRLIARKLGGDIRMRTNGNKTEVTLFLP